MQPSRCILGRVLVTMSVVITDDKVAKVYMESMADLKVKISFQKKKNLCRILVVVSLLSVFVLMDLRLISRLLV